jgi:DeoR/GlpR family transcriptional regulator of sugar metabolism
MLTAERRQTILKLVQTAGSVYVPELSQRFHVSPSTVRRDLEWLADQGQVQRIYGGAMALPSPPAAPATTDDAAQRIGRAAAGLVSAGETVFIGPGGLCRATAQNLCSRSDVTVITNALGVAWTLHHSADLSLIVVGGSLARPSGALVGQLALNAMETLRADRLIIEAAGVSPVEGLTADQLPLADVLRPVLESASQVMVLVAAERLGRTAAAWLGPVSAADVMITGREADPALVWDLSESGVKVTLV